MMRLRGAALCIALLVPCVSCSIVNPDAASLRIVNAGTEPLVALTVFSPGSEVSFGDIASGASTEYRILPGGVYRYSAFEFTHQGQRVMQPVIDWVGESPMQGSQFTYSLRLTVAPQSVGIEILSVTLDR